jgi:hypothetical protein
MLLSPAQINAERISVAKRDGTSAIALVLRGADPEQELKAAQAIMDAGLALYYWIEIGRHAPLADEHPQWMASLQGHPEWRRFHKDFPEPKEDEIVKVYPWTPVFYQEAFEAHERRVAKLLAEMPAATGLFLNDLQGGPSACGCGHPLCRWTSDYGPLRTATFLGDDAPAKFVAAVKTLAPRSEVIPVWTTECEEHDGAKDGLCAGVGCFKGICWKAYCRQLAPVAEQSPRLGALLLYKEFQRDLSEYGEPAGWISWGVKSFQAMPKREGTRPIEAKRLIPILQGWDVTDKELAAQIAQAKSSGASGYVVALSKIDQSWSPRIVKRKSP